MHEDRSSESRAEFRDRIKSIQFGRKPLVVQKDEAGSVQVYHSSGRVDADVHIAAPIMGLAKTNDLEEKI